MLACQCSQACIRGDQHAICLFGDGQIEAVVDRVTEARGNTVGALNMPGGGDVSTPGLIRLLAAQMGKRARLWPVPPGLLELAGKLVGKGAEVQRLVGSLAVDSGKIRRELGWRPPFTLNEGLAETVRWYRGR